jgi:hypothetical protein
MSVEFSFRVVLLPAVVDSTVVVVDPVTVVAAAVVGSPARLPYSSLTRDLPDPVRPGSVIRVLQTERARQSIRFNPAAIFSGTPRPVRTAGAQLSSSRNVGC